MKKVLIGVGIGCGVLVLLMVAGLFVAGMWVKDTMGGTFEAAEAMKAQESQLAELNQEFPFKSPSEGALLALDAQRLESWLRVSESGYAPLEKFEKENASMREQLEATENSADKLGQMNKGLKAMGGVFSLMGELRTTMLATLRTEKMSPMEYQAIFQTVIGTMTQKAALAMGEGMAQAKEAMTAQRKQFEEQLADPSISAEQKEMLEQTLAALAESMDSMDETPSEPQGQMDAKVVDANVALLEKYKERLEKAANPLLVGLLLDGANAMEQVNQGAE